ncbi:MAG: hypothetical protein H7A45_03250 [Verrucomicrobiales bacterium]|nr:hypothetical protein [Verrucomicrobiales bacterium]MCP5527790.1 hypothetical protein [Verrucomicrobiales bacterium]
MSAQEASSAADEFPPTQWSLVSAVEANRGTVSQDALETLCRLYWKPVYHLIRSQARPGEEAIDLTQGFFAHLVEQGLIGRADRRRGRFRSFLHGCVKRYLSGERDRMNTVKRGANWSRLGRDIEGVEEYLVLADQTEAPPDQSYDYACVLALMREALRLLELECASRGRTPIFNALKPYLQGDAAAPDHAETARKLGTTPGTISVTVHRMRHRYRILLRSVVARTLSDPLAVDEELQSLREIIESHS